MILKKSDRIMPPPPPPPTQKIKDMPMRAFISVAILAIVAFIAIEATTVFAQSDDRPVVNIKQPYPHELTEGMDEYVMFTLEATKPVMQDTVVYIRIEETGNFLAYHEMGNLGPYRAVTISQGESTATLELPIHDDLTVEKDGVVRAYVQNGMTHTTNCGGMECDQKQGWSIDSEMEFAAVLVKDDDTGKMHPQVSVYAGRYDGDSMDCAAPMMGNADVIAAGDNAVFTVVVDNAGENYLMVEAMVEGDYIYTPDWYSQSNEGEQAIYITSWQNECMDGDRIIVEYTVPTTSGDDTENGAITLTLKGKGETEYGMYYGGDHYEVNSAMYMATIQINAD